MLKKSMLLPVLAVLAVQPLFAELSSKAKKAEKLVAAGDVPGAVAIYRELMEKNAARNPELVKEGREGMARCQVLQAKAALKDDAFADAEKLLQATIVDYKDTAALKDAYATLAQVRVKVGGALFDAGKYDECVALAKDTRAAVPPDTDGIQDVIALTGKSLFAAGTGALQAKDYAKALHSFAAVATADLAKDDPVIAQSAGAIAAAGKELLALAESRIQAGRYDDALESIGLALTAVTDDAFVAQAKYDTGLANRLNNQPDKALAAYREVQDKYKTTAYAPLAAYDMHLISLDKGSKKDALASITVAATLSPDNIDYLFIRAGLLKETGAADEANKAYQSLVDLLQDRIGKTYVGKEKLQYRLGQAYLNLGSYAEAAIEFDKAVIRDPSFTEARKSLAFAQFQDKNFAGAAQNYEFLIRQDSADLDKLRAGASTSADAATGRQLEQLSQQVAFYHYQNGLCREQMGDYDKAEQECRLGLEGVPTADAAATMKRIQQARAQKAVIPATPVPADQPK